MQKSLGAFLLLVFLFNLAGIFAVFKLQKMLIRNEMMQLLQSPVFEKELTVIRSSPGKQHLEWENDNEFCYQGTMYDVVKKKINSPGESEFYCITDEDETLLRSNLIEMMKKNNSSQQALNNLFKLLGSVFLPAKKVTIDFFSETSLTYHFSFPGILPAEASVLTPPPKTA